MTGLQDYFHAYPQKLKVSTCRSGQWYHRDELYFAAHGILEKQLDLPIIWASPDDEISVLEGDPRSANLSSKAEKLSPVYRQPPKGPLLVPTGLVFVRFKERVAVEDRKRQIANAGFEIFSIPPYAPHSGWLKSADGQMSSALARIQRLETLSDIVSIEPQLLGPRVQR